VNMGSDPFRAGTRLRGVGSDPILGGARLVAVAAIALTAIGAGQREVPVSWEPQTSGVTARLRGVSAVSSSVAWASGAGGTVLRTTDGGRTWTLSIGPGEASRIYQTTDGGVTWTERFGNMEPSAFFDAMAFADASRGVAISDSVGGRFVIRETSDGGRTWTAVPPERLPPAREGEGAFAASGSNVDLVGRERIWIGLSSSRVLRSTDGGRTWTVHDTPVATAEATGIFSIAFRDAQHGVVVGGDYGNEAEAIDNVALTSDGGTSWTRPTRQGLSGFRSAVAWVPRRDRTLLAVGPNGADWSTDDGRSWQPAGGEGYDALSLAPSGDVGWAVGSNGRIARVTIR
jgi:photosystem II stability/assembly factor-like uncharacterized protein